MLADFPDTSEQRGTLDSEVHKPATFLNELMMFVGVELPKWRDRTDRPDETSEEALTSQLCAHLNSASRHAPGWDILQFRMEVPDERRKSRRIDLVPSPAGTTICIEGRRHVDFDSLMPIECKRLPTPSGQNRDEREYVFSQHSSIGGIQRFKDGVHGAAHGIGAMIGYVQKESNSFWTDAVAGWITALAGVTPGWSLNDLLSVESTNTTARTAFLRSSHQRSNGLPIIDLRHLWVEML